MAVDEAEDGDVAISDRTHREMERLARERGEEYDRDAVERRAEEWVENAPHPVRDAEPVEGNEEAFEEWKAGFDLDDEE